MKVSGSDFNSSVIRREELLFSCALRDQNSSTINKSESESEPEPASEFFEPFCKLQGMNRYVVVAGKRNQPEPDDNVNNNNDHKPLPKSFHQVRANATSSVWDSGIKELTDPGKEHFTSRLGDCTHVCVHPIQINGASKDSHGNEYHCNQPLKLGRNLKLDGEGKVTFSTSAAWLR